MNQKKLTRKEKLARQRSHPEKSTGKTKDRKYASAFPGLLVALLGFLLYANSLKNDFALDDISAIEKNWVVKQGVSAVPVILKTSYRYGYRDSADELYRPLPLMVFATLWDFFPGNPFPFHLMNVVLYALTGFLLYKLLRQLFRDYHPLLAFSAAVLFIAHPLHSEVVANIKSLDEILSFLFIILTFQQLLNYVEWHRSKNLIMSWIFFFLAFLCKEGTIVMLAAIPLALVMFTKAPRSDIIRITAGLSAAAFIFIAMRANALGGMAVGKTFQIQENVLTAAPDIFIRFATIFFVMLQYLRLMLVPFPLSSDYSFPEWNLVSWSSPWPWLSLVTYGTLLFIALKTFQKNKIISFSILFFFITISLYSNMLMTIGSLFGERFLYIPLLGFTIALSWLILNVLKIPVHLQSEESAVFILAHQKVFITLAVFVLPYGLITVSRNAEWKDTVTLFSKDVLNRPNSALLHYNYANELKAEKAEQETDPAERNAVYDSSIQHYRRALELHPGYEEVHEQLGLAFYRRGNDSAAFAHVEKALDLNPRRSTAYNSLGTLYFEKRRDYGKALELYLQSVKMNPNYIDGWRNVGAAYGTLGQFDKAIEAFQQVLRLDPVNVTVLNFMAQTYRSMGNVSSADLYERKAREAAKLKR